MTVLVRSTDFSNHNMSKQSTSFGQSDIVRLSDEDASVELLERAVTGLWEVVNDLTRFRRTTRQNYRVTIFGSARLKPATPAYEQVKKLAAELTKMGCDIISGGGPGLMQAANEGAHSVHPKALKKFTIIIVAEGAREKDHDFVTSATDRKLGEARLGGIGALVAAQVEKRAGKESRVCVLGHLQRGGSPTTFDRALCSMFGATAVELVAAGEFGKMVAFTGAQISAVKISDAIGKINVVHPDGNLVRTARALGICLGD